MAAAKPQLHITINHFRGNSDENWPDFESLLTSLINKGNIAANQPQFLQLPLFNEDLHFSRTLPQATRNNFELSIAALGNHHCNPNLRELHKLQLHNSKVDHKTKKPDDCLVEMQLQAKQAYPLTIFAPILPANPPSNQNELDKAATQAAKQVVLNNSVNERNSRIKDFHMCICKVH